MSRGALQDSGTNNLDTHLIERNLIRGSDHRATGGESFLDRVNSRTDRRSGSRVLLSLRKIGI
jgi:hypothetical protein